ncbi:hypothetical protein M8J76_017078 [Diaphorina citri]|nr:hypothetical protein M8J76_017078 [Diaphorina citri]
MLTSLDPESEILKNIKCAHSKSAYILKHALGQNALNVLISKLQKNFYSIIVDESTDISSVKSLAIVVRYYDEELKDVNDAFLTSIDIEDASSQGLYDAIIQFFTSTGIPLEKMLGFAADNCSVMMGQHRGLQARLKEVNKNLYVFGCICHSFHICASEACKRIPQAFEDLCSDIYNYLQKKPKRLGEFKEIQKMLKIKTHNLLKLSRTRWLSMNDVIERVVEQWDALLSYFCLSAIEDKEHKALPIKCALEDKKTKAYFLFLNFFLPTIAKLNVDYQGTKFNLHNFLNDIGTKLKVVMKYFMDPIYVNNTPFEHLNPNIPAHYLKLEDIYCGARVESLLITLNKTDRKAVERFKIDCLNFYVEFCNQILKRVDFKDPILKNMVLLCPEKAKSDHCPSIINLAHFFPNVISEKDLETLDAEWRYLKCDEEIINTELELLNFWNQVFRREAKYPMLTKLVKSMFALPHSSAATERVFSAINNNKTKLRNQLETPMINGLLLTKEHIKKSSAAKFQITYSLRSLAKRAHAHASASKKS